MFVLLLLTHNTKGTEQIYKNLDLRFVRQSASAPAGKPDLLFEVPFVIGYRKQGVAVQEYDIGIAIDILGISHHTV